MKDPSRQERPETDKRKRRKIPIIPLVNVEVVRKLISRWLHDIRRYYIVKFYCATVSCRQAEQSTNTLKSFAIATVPQPTTWNFICRHADFRLSAAAPVAVRRMLEVRRRDVVPSTLATEPATVTDSALRTELNNVPMSSL